MNVSAEKRVSQAKKIVIKDCSECPHKDHKGGFGEVSYIPICIHIRIIDRRELPYTVGLAHNVVVASPTYVIPEWCPLTDNN